MTHAITELMKCVPWFFVHGVAGRVDGPFQDHLIRHESAGQIQKGGDGAKGDAVLFSSSPALYSLGGRIIIVIMLSEAHRREICWEIHVDIFLFFQDSEAVVIFFYIVVVNTRAVARRPSLSDQTTTSFRRLRPPRPK